MVQRQYLNNGKVQCLTQMQEAGPYQRTEDTSPLNQELNDSLEQCVELFIRSEQAGYPIQFASYLRRKGIVRVRLASFMVTGST